MGLFFNEVSCTNSIHKTKILGQWHWDGGGCEYALSLVGFTARFDQGSIIGYGTKSSWAGTVHLSGLETEVEVLKRRVLLELHQFS